jgi:two-component system chemotaxis sensor kinase CheA
MNKNNDEFMKRLLSTFNVEAGEHLRNMTSGLIDLEKDLEPKRKGEIIEEVFREAHSLKGAARAVSMSEVETICQSLESLFSLLKQQGLQLSPGLLDAMHRAVDTVRDLVVSGGGQGQNLGKDRISGILEELAGIERGEIELIAGPGPERPAAGDRQPQAGDEISRQPATAGQKTDTIRISLEKTDELFRKAEEMLSLKLLVRQSVDDIKNLTGMLGDCNKQWVKVYPVIRNLRRTVEKSDKQARGREKVGSHDRKLLEFGETAHDTMKLLESRLDELGKTAEGNRYAAELMVDNLLEDVKKILMLPFSVLLEPFPKLVRDLSRDQGKEVELVVRAEEIEIDRRILEEARTVFVHLLRNAVDHGIGKPDERTKNGKPARGTITIGVARAEDKKVEISISDDGRGIDTAKLREMSVKRGLILPEEAERLTEDGILSLAFESGVSTSPIITDISGRGLGLAIVREKVENLGGQVLMQTERNGGTTFKVVLPLTLATFRGVLVTVGGREFVVPTANVKRAVSVRKDEIKTVENRETVSVEGTVLPLVRLGDILGIPGKKNGSQETAAVLILEFVEKRIGLSVDDVLDEREILLKGLGYPLVRVKNITGATILGSGKVLPILNVADLVKSASSASVAVARPGIPEAGDETAKRSVIVVEDSITSRMLLKSILETAGYLVKTAVDGVDAMTMLKTEAFDLVVSDVDMPRMNGFNLTEQIRGDKKLAELPVVLVTALESREDRERGIDVGANAYIVKSSFDQSNLLEVIKRLI